MGIIEFLKTMSIRNKIKVISVFPLIFIIILSFFLNFCNFDNCFLKHTVAKLQILV